MGTGSVMPCPIDPLNDADGDGVCGDLDGCENPDLAPMVAIDGLDTRVTKQSSPLRSISRLDLHAICRLERRSVKQIPFDGDRYDRS